MDVRSSPAAFDPVKAMAGIVTSYVSGNAVPPSELPRLISVVHGALLALGVSVAPPTPSARKATPLQVRRSITPEAIVSFIDGKPYRTLRRHLAKHGLHAAAYRERYGLPADYPMTAPDYSARRSEIARGIGLGVPYRSGTDRDLPPSKRKRSRPATD